jgi:hypothetical protein
LSHNTGTQPLPRRRNFSISGLVLVFFPTYLALSGAFRRCKKRQEFGNQCLAGFHWNAEAVPVISAHALQNNANQMTT